MQYLQIQILVMSLNNNRVVITIDGFYIYPQVSENRKGSYGVVVDAVRISDRKEFVMKFFGYTKQKPDISYILREIDNLQILKNSPGVAHIETVLNDNIEGYISQTIPKLHRRVYPVIVMEKLCGNELFESILAKQDHDDKFSEFEAAIIFKTFILALDKIHNEKNMIIVDLKSENLVFSDNTNYTSIKVIDFGMAVSMSGRIEHFDDSLSGTGAYLAPESIFHHQKFGQAKFSRASDVWQASCILFTLLTVSFPFGSNHTPNLHERIKKCMFINRDLQSIQAKYRLSNEVIDLFSRMFTVNPSQRITCKEILNHPWILQKAEKNPFGDEYFERLKSFQCQRKFKQILNQSTILSIQQQLQAELSTTRYIDDDTADQMKSQSHVLGFSLVETRNTPDYNFNQNVNIPSGDCTSPKVGTVNSGGETLTSSSLKTVTIVEPVVSTLSESYGNNYSPVSMRDRSPASSNTSTTPMATQYLVSRQGGSDMIPAEMVKRKRGNNSRKIVTVNFVITYEGIQVLKEKFLAYMHTEMTDEAVTKKDGLEFHDFQQVVLSAGFSNLATEKVFRIFDWNGSGTVSYLEFLLALSSFRRDINWDDTESIARLYYDIFDVNNDGSVSVEVLAVVLSQLHEDFTAIAHKKLLEKQKAATVDDLNTLQNNSYLMTHPFEMYPDEVYALVSFMDTDKDGSISYEEFERFLTSINSLINSAQTSAVKEVTGNAVSNINTGMMLQEI